MSESCNQEREYCRNNPWFNSGMSLVDRFFSPVTCSGPHIRIVLYPSGPVPSLPVPFSLSPL